MNNIPLREGSTVGMQIGRPLPIVQAPTQALITQPKPISQPSTIGLQKGPAPAPLPAQSTRSGLIDIPPTSGLAVQLIRGIWWWKVTDGSGRWWKLDIRTDLVSVFLDVVDANGKVLHHIYGKYRYQQASATLTLTLFGQSYQFTVVSLKKMYDPRYGYWGGSMSMRNATMQYNFITA